MKKYPFKFLDSYDKDDRGIFFGRNEEINALYEMVFQSSVMLVYGASGTGKTSLINCGLASKFQPHDWLDLMIRRGNNINDSLEKALYDAGGSPANVQVDTKWLDEWSDDTVTTTAELSPVTRSIKAVYQKSFRPVYLIFDQFEELFILGSVKEQELFIHTIQDILQSKQPVKMIFSIREEYLGELFDFEKAVPQLLQKKLRIEPMNLEKVKQVVIGAAEYEDSNIHIKSGESEMLAEGIFNKIRGKGKSLTIQLPFLQVLLDKYYMKITGDESREAEAEFSMQGLNALGEIGDILVNFLEEQVAGISNKLKDKYPALTTEIIWKILSPFSTLEGTKEPISKKDLYDRLPGYNTTMIDDVVDAFTKSRILRSNEATEMFEITHDSLAKPIADKRSVEETALLEIRRLVKSQVSVKGEAREYFTEKQLLFIEPYLDKFKVTDEEQAWISTSRDFIKEQKAAEKKKQQEELIRTRKRLRTVYGLLGMALIAIVAAVLLYFNANKQKAIAQRERKTIEEIHKTSVGQKYQGGIIFYCDRTRKHGLIAAENDLPGENIYTWDSAKAACKKYAVSEGDIIYHDWFLPGKDALAVLYFYSSTIGGFEINQPYWTCSEASADRGIYLSFFNGAQIEDDKKIKLHVRPVRAF